MRSIVLIAAMVLVSASAQAEQFRNLSVAGTASHPIAAPLPATPANVVAEAQAATPAPAAVAAPAPVTAAPETGAPPVPPPLAATAPATTAAPAAAPATDAPKYVERPTVAPAAADTKVDDSKPSRRAERHHRGGYWTAGRIIGELHRYGVYW